MQIKGRQILVYPFLFAIHPLLNLYIINVHQVPLLTLIKPLLLILSITLALYLITLSVLKVNTSSGLLTTLVAVFILHYGAVAKAIANVSFITSTVADWQEYLLISWILLAIILSILLVKKPFSSIQTNSYLNFLSIAVVGVTLYQIAGRVPDVLVNLDEVLAKSSSESTSQTHKLNTSIHLEAPPDVYYIILDGYGREDILRDYYDFDNSAFIDTLASKGFYVAGESRSNYSQTAMSLPSSLNINYLKDLGVLTEGLSTPQRTRLSKSLVQNNALIKQFKDLGYTTINFDSGFSFFTSNNNFVDISYEFQGMDEFNTYLL